jgi:cytochrome P450
MLYNHFYAGALLAFILLVLRPIFRALLSSLRSVPGPFLARFTRLWEFRAVRKHDFATYNIALHKKYGTCNRSRSHQPLTPTGPIVRLAPNRYSINDAEASRIILGHHNALNKSNYYLPFGDPSQPNSFSELDIQVHAKVRRPTAHLYSNNNLLSYEPFVDTCNNILLKRLREYSWTGQRLDFRELMQYYAFDVIGEITLGSRFGFMEEDGDNAGIISALDDGMAHGATIGLVPEIHLMLCAATKYLKIEPAFTKINNFIMGNIQNRVSGRTKSPDDRQDFLDKLLPLEQSGKTSRSDTVNACGANIAAGSDTTAISLTAAIAFLTMNPEALAKLRKELNEAGISDPITFKEAQKLPYLHAVIYEALRLHPAVGAPLTRIVGHSGAELAGHYFPAGTEVGVNAWVVHRDTSIFGQDADEFKPERWLTNDAEKRAAMDRNFLSFGAGPRVCLGKNISLLEMFKVIPQIVRRFEFEVINGDEKDGGYSWKTLWFTKQKFDCIVRARENT